MADRWARGVGFIFFLNLQSGDFRPKFECLYVVQNVWKNMRWKCLSEENKFKNMCYLKIYTI